MPSAFSLKYLRKLRASVFCSRMGFRHNNPRLSGTAGGLLNGRRGSDAEDLFGLAHILHNGDREGAALLAASAGDAISGVAGEGGVVLPHGLRKLPQTEDRKSVV